MKALLYALAFVLSLVPVTAAVFKLDGDLTWEITEPRLTFKLDGNLQNLSPSGSTSGTIRLVLWATSEQVPSRVEKVGEFTLGQIGGGYQFTDFTVKTTSKIPDISGNYRFTIAVTEFTTASWRNVAIVPTGTRSLENGNFTDQKKWLLPAGKAVAPPNKIGAGDLLTLRLRATSERNLFPLSSQLTTILDVKSQTRLVARSTDRKRTPNFKYAVVKDTFKNKRVQAGRLTLTYRDSTAVVTLYFQGPGSGTYKVAERISGTSETTWGMFSLK